MPDIPEAYAEQLLSELTPGTYGELWRELLAAVQKAYRRFDTTRAEGLFIVHIFVDRPECIVRLRSYPNGDDAPSVERFFIVTWQRDAAGGIALETITEAAEEVVYRPLAELTAEMDGDAGDAQPDAAGATQPDDAGDAPPDQAFTSTLVWEMSQPCPQVPTFGHVDTALLYTGDPDPQHIVLPVARVGLKSRNGITYDEWLVQSIAEQLKGQGGIRGHIPDKDRAHAFPTDDVDWIGARRVGGTLWAKAYVPPGATRNHLRRKKATGGKVGTSIYGVMRWRRDKPGGKFAPVAFQLESLDLAPSTRASLNLGGDFSLVAEIAAEVSAASAAHPNQPFREENTMPQEITRESVIAALTPADAGALPAGVRDAVIAEYTQDQDYETRAQRIAELTTEVGAMQTQVAELTTARDTAETRVAELETTLAELATERETLQTRIAEFERSAFLGEVDAVIAEFTDWPAHGDDAQAQLGALRGAMRRSLLAEMGATTDVEAARSALQNLWDAEFKVLAELARDALAGPGAGVPGAANRGQTGQTVGEAALESVEATVKRIGV